MRGAVFGCFLVFAAFLSGVGCQGGGSASTPDADFYSCADDSRAPPYTQGMTVTSTLGLYTVKLLDSTFTDSTGTHSQAPTKGDNVWTVEVQDAVTAAPLDGVTMVVTPRMPDHAHGTSAVGVTPLGGGEYTLDPVYLIMTGFWQVTVDLSAATASSGADAGAASDTAVFLICVSG